MMVCGNIMANLPEILENEDFLCLVEDSTVKIERIVSRGHVTPLDQWYEEKKSEWVMVLEGCARLTFVDEPPIILNRGDYITIPARKKHRVDWTDPEQKTVWLAVFF
ncbi:MAG: cupin domain-containing protein [Desulfobacteraceae bacterium]|nr:cupin domain-containing protein [Desulfobacteraceae bacterium]